MSAKQSNTGNKIKRLCIYSLLCAVCMIIGYIESLFDLSFIAPGVKLGLSNSIACALIFTGDIKGAVFVNISRILLSSLLFGSPVSLVFALCGGILSLLVMVLLSKTHIFSVIGTSILGGTAHNLAQCAVGLYFVGFGVVYYLPILLISGMVCGAACGILSDLVIKRSKGNINNV